jgi:hypothetical protein
MKLSPSNKLTTISDSLNICFNNESTIYLFDYINSLKHTNLYINSSSKTNINLALVNNSLFMFIIKSIANSTEKIYNSDYSHFFEPLNYWNICICDNVMFNLPFTIKNYIYIPLNYLENCFNNNNSMEFEKTLIHEKIHINQRTNYIKWIKLVDNLFSNKWKIITINNNFLWNLIETNIEQLSQYIFISNPDIDYKNFKYVYITNGKIYYANYIYLTETKNIIIKYFHVNTKTNKFEETYELLDFQDHPFETFAYQISDIICK